MLGRLLILLLFVLSCNPTNKSTCSEGNCKNGEGTREYSDGGIERGNWISGRLNGIGSQSFGTASNFSGDTYSGHFVNNEYSGFGTYYDKSEDSEYVGEWKDGKPDGNGICKWGEHSLFPNRYYDGYWKEGLMNGFGVKFWGIAENELYTNNKYTGEWKDNIMDGIGTYEWADGSSYVGSWRNGEQQGEGVYIFKNGEAFEGIWNDGYCKELAEEMGLE